MERFSWLVGLLGVIWALQVINIATGYTLNVWFGLLPRSFGGLDGIALMPVLHGSIAHAVSNSFPLIVLGAILSVTAKQDVFAASAIIIVIGGVGVWLFGRTALHVGASGLVFGWFAYLVARGAVERRPIPILAAVGVVVVYGSLIWGVFPGEPGVSWESHFFGVAAGAIAAFVLRGSARAG